MNKKEAVGYVIALLVYILLIWIFSIADKHLENIDLDPVNKVSAEVVKVKSVEQVKSVEHIKEKSVVKRLGTSKESEEVKKHKQEIVDYLWAKSKNIDLILTFEYESRLDERATFENKRVNTEGEIYVKSIDNGLCMLNDQYHIAFIEDDEFKNWKAQADYCIRVYNDGIKKGKIRTTFFGYDHRLERRSLYYINQEAYNEYWNK